MQRKFIFGRSIIIMGVTNKYDDMSALEALKLAKDHFLVLPDIQREYV